MKFRNTLHGNRKRHKVLGSGTPYRNSIMQHYSFRLTILLVFISQLFTPVFAAAPVKRQVLKALEVSQNAQANPKTITLSIQLNYPFRYSRHFPSQAGDTIIIEVQPFSLANITEPEFTERESLVAPDEVSWLLNGVTYEGDQGSSAKIWVSFWQPVKYELSQGRDFRSITIIVRNDFPEQRKSIPR